VIKQMLKDAGFTLVNYDEVMLRQEKGKDCIGYLFEAKK